MNNDTLLCILDFLQLHDLINLSSVSKQWHHVANNQFLWKSLFKHKFVNNIMINNYKIQYKKCHTLDIFLRKTIWENINESMQKHTLCLANKKLQLIPAEIALLHNLQTLHLGHNNLRYIPSEIGLLYNLQTLILCDNILQHIPPEIGSLHNLQELNLSRNQLQNIPQEIGLLTNLQTLTLNSNQLQTIPYKITQLSLLTLYLHQTQTHLITNNAICQCIYIYYP